MLSLIRELPWPSIIKVFALGIACKTLYIFYSESSDTKDDIKKSPVAVLPIPASEPILPIQPIQPILPIQESREDLHRQMKLVYQELLKILPQLENIYDKLETIHTKLGHTQPIDTPEFLIESNHVNIINENVLIEKIQFEQAQFIQGRIEVDESIKTEPESINVTEIELKEPESIHVTEIELKEPESIHVNEIELKEPESINVTEIELKEPESFNVVSNAPESEVQPSCETPTHEINNTEALEALESLDTPKSIEKTCSFILRSGLRKGQLCNSKVKGKTQIYCGIHR